MSDEAGVAPELSAEQVGFRYGARGRQVLADVSLPLLPGVLLVLLGPNGSGKSTLIKCLAGIHRPTQGKVQLRNRDLGRLPARQIAASIAYAPQSVPAPFAFTVAEFLDLGSTTPSTENRTTVLEAFELTGMLDRSLLSLSGGEKQRTVAARAFAQRTPVLLLDEPTAHLDLRHQVRLMEAARERARQGTAVCVVLHDLNLAAAFADRLVVLHEGRVAAAGTVAEVMQQAVLDSVYHAAVQVLTRPSGTPIVIPVSDTTPDTNGVQDLTVS